MEIGTLKSIIERCETNTIKNEFRYVVVNSHGEIEAGFCFYDDADLYYAGHDDGYYQIISLFE